MSLTAPPLFYGELARLRPSTPRIDVRSIFWPERSYEAQQRFVFGGHTQTGCAFYQGWIGGRASGKTVGLGLKAVVLALLNPGHLGAICGRTNGEVAKKILPKVFAAVAAIRRATGVALLAPRGYDKHDQSIHFANGSTVYILSYGRRDQLELIRGYDLAWALFDELERCPGISSSLVVETVAPAIRAPGALHKVFGWASSPDGLRGMPQMHLDAYEKGDESFYTVATTIYDNPFLERATIRNIRRGMSYRQWLQEGLGSCLLPLNVIYGEYREDRHVVPYRWSADDLTLICVDWPGQVGYCCAIKINRLSGRWVVAHEFRASDISTPAWRLAVDAFVGEVVKRDGGRAVYAMACDRSPQEEAYWLINRFSKMCAGKVLFLTKSEDQRVEFGHGLVSYMLDPDAGRGEPRLVFSSDLEPTLETARMGMRGSMQRYGWEQIRGPDGMQNVSVPNKKNNADHAPDALRYGVTAFRFDPQLHGGAPLPFALTPESSPHALGAA